RISIAPGSLCPEVDGPAGVVECDAQRSTDLVDILRVVEDMTEPVVLVALDEHQYTTQLLGRDRPEVADAIEVREPVLVPRATGVPLDDRLGDHAVGPRDGDGVIVVHSVDRSLGSEI